ncbi:hypothetical protein BKA70DRAFT_1219983 [Coprinopsis sp. MPI-PUGE-AT-0042]|nr:hypothetical protein BKA70DRAFT_1219983 [Coprinopsis sp. MPI-PUGE-AT-0042]
MPSSRQTASTRRQSCAYRHSSQQAPRRVPRSRSSTAREARLTVDVSPSPSNQPPPLSQAPRSSRSPSFSQAPPPSPVAPSGSGLHPLLGAVLDSLVGSEDWDDGEPHMWVYRSPITLAALHERPCADEELRANESLSRVPRHEAMYEVRMSALDQQSRIVASPAGIRVLFQNNPEYSLSSWDN